MRGEVRLVQCGGMKDRMHAAHGALYRRPIDDGADVSGERTLENIEADNFVIRSSQRPNQRLA